MEKYREKYRLAKWFIYWYRNVKKSRGLCFIDYNDARKLGVGEADRKEHAITQYNTITNMFLCYRMDWKHVR